MQPSIARALRATAALLALLLALTAAAANAEPAASLTCEAGKAIERSLGQRGFRVVVAGGYRMRDDRPVKVQVWENEDSNWVITEAYLRGNRTCVVRTGRGLHMLY